LTLRRDDGTNSDIALVVWKMKLACPEQDLFLASTEKLHDYHASSPVTGFLGDARDHALGSWREQCFVKRPAIGG